MLSRSPAIRDGLEASLTDDLHPQAGGARAYLRVACALALGAIGCVTSPGTAAASPVLEKVWSDAGASRARASFVSASADEIQPAALQALAAIAPGAGEAARRLPVEHYGAALGRDGAAAALRRGVRRLVGHERRSGFVDDAACGFAQDVEIEPATAGCGSPLRLAISTIPGLALMSRAASVSPPDVRFAVAPEVLVSAIPSPTPAWLLAALVPLLARRAFARAARTAP